jgi:hypothetical protein
MVMDPCFIEFILKQFLIISLTDIRKKVIFLCLGRKKQKRIPPDHNFNIFISRTSFISGLLLTGRIVFFRR